MSKPQHYVLRPRRVQAFEPKNPRDRQTIAGGADLVRLLRVGRLQAGACAHAQAARRGQRGGRLLAQRRLLALADDLLQQHLPHILLRAQPHTSRGRPLPSGRTR